MSHICFLMTKHNSFPLACLGVCQHFYIYLDMRGLEGRSLKKKARVYLFLPLIFFPIKLACLLICLFIYFRKDYLNNQLRGQESEFK